MKLAGFPLKVRPAFFVIAALLGGAGRAPIEIASWLGAVFVSVLIHELGHASVGRLFGLSPSIELYERGGLTTFAPGGPKLAAWKRVAISLAGPGAGFVLAGAVLLTARAADPARYGALASLFVEDMLWCNFGWGIANLLPILPLDGGNVARDLLGVARPATADRDARILSILAAAAAAAWALWRGWSFGALYAAWVAAPNVQVLLQRRAEARAQTQIVDGAAQVLLLARAGHEGDALRVFTGLAGKIDARAQAALSESLFYAGAFHASEVVSRDEFTRFGRVDAAYNVACALARLGKVDEGIEWLGKAEAAGFHDAEKTKGDADLEALRIDARFAEVVERMAASRPSPGV